MGKIFLICLLFFTSLFSQTVYSQTGSEQRGRTLLLEHSFAQGANVYAMSPSEFYNLYLVWPKELKNQAQAATPIERRRMIREYYGLYNTPGKNDSNLDVPPLGWIAVSHGRRWEASCLACHAGTVKTLVDGQLVDQLIIGLGNNRLDLSLLTDDRYTLIKNYPSVARVPIYRKLLFQRSWDLIRKVMNSKSRGTHNIQQGVALNIYSRDADLNIDWANTTNMFLGYFPNLGPTADVDAPPWWNTKNKTHLYASGVVPKTPRSLSTSFLSIGNEPIQWAKEYNNDLMAFIDSVKAPKYPFGIDEIKAQQGKVLFENTCSKCHGTYDSTGSTTYRTRYIPREIIETDPNGSEPWSRAIRQRYANSWLGDYGKENVLIDTKGYVVPPLTGVWASAPYLHNGSVPALKYMLFIEKTSDGKWIDTVRPSLWKTDFESYDTTGVGFVIQTRKPNQLSEREERTWFDTTNRTSGKTNIGHSNPAIFFTDKNGKTLNAEEKSQILEYLKTL